MDATFQCLKAWICQTLLSTTLTYYDTSKPVIVQTDASKYGLGAALMQCGHPITFASKMFIDVKNLLCKHRERECLSVCFSLKTFHTYLYGRHVTIQNDHKPLVMIQQKPIHAAPPDFNACSFTCKNTTTPFDTSQVKNSGS